MSTDQDRLKLMTEKLSKAKQASGDEKTALIDEFWTLASEAVNALDILTPYESTGLQAAEQIRQFEI